MSAMRPSMASSKSVVGKPSRSFIHISQVVKIGATAVSVSETSTAFRFLETFLSSSGVSCICATTCLGYRGTPCGMPSSSEFSFLSSTERRNLAWR